MLFRKNKGKEKDDSDNNYSEVDNSDENPLIVQEKDKNELIQEKDKERPFLLPSALASRITTMTTTSCLKIRNASSIVDTLYELAKAGTDASFDLSRNILIRAIKIARSIHRDEENENPNSFIKALDACTDFGINVINNTFSATEVMTLTSFHIAQKGLRYTFKWAEEALNVLDSVFGKTETSREISALISLIQSEIGNYVKNERNIIKKGMRSINFVKAITAYACLQIMTYETILKKRKLTLLYEGDSYLESVPLNLIESEEKDFFTIMDNNNDNDDSDNDNNDSNDDDDDKGYNNKKSKDNDSKKTRNETTKFLLSTLALSKTSSKKIESPIESDDDKKSFLDEALHNINNYSPTFAFSITDKLDPEILSRTSSQDEKDSNSSDSSLNDVDNMNPEKYIYPKQHLVKNITKFIKFASGVYGRHFMRFLDIGQMRSTTTVDTYLHPNDYAFSIHTNTPLENILYSSYSSKTTSTTNNIAHIISVDHDMKAIIVSLRGTLGFYDFIIDLEFDYETIIYNGKEYHVHSGIYQSAKIISQPNSVIHNIVRVALNDYPDYGLVLCGHSLGGGVASMVGLLWTDPKKPYVTGVDSKLPPNRPLHVYSYGTPSCMDEKLAKHCRTFMTSVVNHYDIIPRLSIGILTDLRNCADELLDEKNHGLAEEIFSRSLATFNKSNSDKELNWFWDKFLHLKKHMNTEKLLPPGVVYIIETADIPVMEQSSYEINNFTKMQMPQEYLEYYHENMHDINQESSNSTSTTGNIKKLISTNDKNLAYVDMIIDSIHNISNRSPVYKEPNIEENKDEKENEVYTHKNNEINENLMTSLNHTHLFNNEDEKRNENKENINDEKEKKEENDGIDNTNELQEEIIPKSKRKSSILDEIDSSSFSSEEQHTNIEMNQNIIEETSFADIDDDDDILELNVTDENRKRTLDKMKQAMQLHHNNDKEFNPMFVNHQGFEDNKQGRLYTSNHAKKSSKYYSRAPSTLPNKKNNMKRVILLRCDDVKEQFSELAFAKCMFFDHAPGNYENLLNALENAIFKNTS